MNFKNQIMENTILDDNLFKGEEKEIIPLRFAGFWIRFVASFLDGLIMLPLAIVNIFAITYFNSIPIYVLSILLSAAYKPFCEFKFGATLGKMAIDLKVVNEKFQKISIEQALLRATPFLLSSIIGILMILLIDINNIDENIGFLEFGEIMQNSNYYWLENISNLILLVSCLVVAFDTRKQGLHDKLAKTYCVYKN